MGSQQSTPTDTRLITFVPPPSDHTVDLVFVHGLSGDDKTTWTNNKDVLWPQEWIPSSLPTAAVYSYGYPNDATLWSSDAGRMPLLRRAENLLFILHAKRVGTDKPVVLLGHSMGGLVIKQALVKAHEMATQPLHPNEDAGLFVSNVKGVVFFGTPHRGSSVADWVNFFSLITRASVSTKLLKSFSEPLLDLNQRFLALNIPSHSFAETKPYKGMVVVGLPSADMGVGGLHPCGAVDSNHKTICKPSSHESAVYILTIDAIKPWLIAHSPPLSHRRQRVVGTKDQGSRPKLLFAGIPGSQEAGSKVDQELEIITREIFSSYDVIRRFDCSFEELLKALDDEKPRILHFGGHSENHLEFLPGISAETLVEALALYQNTLMVVFFNTCDSDSIASKMHPRIPNIIGMKDKISDHNAKFFSRHFYRSFIDSGNAEKAFNFAKLELENHSPDAKNVPRFYGPKKLPALSARESLDYFRGGEIDTLPASDSENAQPSFQLRQIFPGGERGDIEREAIPTVIRLLKEKHHCVIAGLSGSGKSVLAEQVIAQLTDDASRHSICVDVRQTFGAHLWAQFVKTFQHFWSHKLFRSADAFSTDIDEFCAVLDQEISVLVIDDFHNVVSSQSTHFSDMIQQIIQKVRHCCVLILSQDETNTTFKADISLKDGVTPEESTHLFTLLRPEESSKVLSLKEDIVCVAKLVSGHISPLRKIFIDERLFRECVQDVSDVLRLRMVYDNEKPLRKSFERRPENERRFILCLAMLRRKMPLSFVAIAGKRFGVTELDIFKLSHSHWICFFSEGSRTVVSIKDFEREFLLRTHNLADFHNLHEILSGAFDECLDPLQFYANFYSLTPAEYPFFPDEAQQDVEKALWQKELDLLPGVAPFHMLTEMIYHYLKSGQFDRQERAMRLFLIVERLMFLYDEKGDLLHLIHLCNQACRGNSHLLHAQFKIRLIRMTITDKTAEAAESDLSNLKLEIERGRLGWSPRNTQLVNAIMKELEGTIQRKKGQENVALERYEEALPLFKEAENIKGQASSHNFAATCSESIGLHKKAIDHFLAAYQLSDVKGRYRDVQYAWKNSFNAARLMADYDERAKAQRVFLLSLSRMFEYFNITKDRQNQEMCTKTYQLGKLLFSNVRMGLIFDCDGILVDTEGLKFESWRYVLSEISSNVFINRPQYQKVVGLSGNAIWQQFSMLIPEDQPIPSSSDVVAKVGDRYSYLRENGSAVHPIKSGATLLHGAIKAKPSWLPGVQVAIASSDSRERIIENLQVLGIGGEDLKEITIVSAETESLEPKPHPAIYLAACNALRMEPKDCVVFEDSQAGIESSIAGGLRCISIKTSDSALQDHSRATLTVTQDQINATDIPIVVGWVRGIFTNLSPAQQADMEVVLQEDSEVGPPFYVAGAINIAVNWIKSGFIDNPRFVGVQDAKCNEVYFCVVSNDPRRLSLDLSVTVGCSEQSMISRFVDCLKDVPYFRLENVCWEEDIRKVLVEIPEEQFAPYTHKMYQASGKAKDETCDQWDSSFNRTHMLSCGKEMSSCGFFISKESSSFLVTTAHFVKEENQNISHFNGKPSNFSHFGTVDSVNSDMDFVLIKPKDAADLPQTLEPAKEDAVLTGKYLFFFGQRGGTRMGKVIEESKYVVNMPNGHSFTAITLGPKENFMTMKGDCGGLYAFFSGILKRAFVVGIHKGKVDCDGEAAPRHSPLFCRIRDIEKGSNGRWLSSASTYIHTFLQDWDARLQQIKLAGTREKTVFKGVKIESQALIFDFAENTTRLNIACLGTNPVIPPVPSDCPCMSPLTLEGVFTVNERMGTDGAFLEFYCSSCKQGYSNRDSSDRKTFYWKKGS